MCLAVPGKILSINNDNALFPIGKVSFGGISKEVNLVYVPESTVGDYVIVHVGFAISLLNQDEAKRVFDDLENISKLDQGEL